MGSMLDRMRSSREFNAELEPGKHLRMRRPLAARMPEFRAGVTPELVAEYAIGWDGVTEADLLPPGLGNSEPVPFSQDVAREALMDNPKWLESVMRQLVGAINAWLEQQVTTAKN